MLVLSTMPSYRRELIKALFKRTKPSNYSFDELKVSLSHIRIDTRQLSRYNRYFAFSDNEIPLPFWFVFSQPAQLALFNLPQFPASVVGLVHTGLVIEKHRPGQVDDEYQVSLSVQSCEKTDKGLKISLHIVIQSNGEKVISLQSDYLSPSRDRKAGKPKSNARPFDTSEARKVEYDVRKARKYARISGDYNPIHLSSALARLFGFRQPILHGMYSVASLYAYSYKRNIGSDKQMRVKFKRPLFLPQSAYILQMDTRGYLINSDGKACVEMVW